MIEDLINDFNNDKHNEIFKKQYVDEKLNKQLNEELLASGFEPSGDPDDYDSINTKCFRDYLFDINSYKDGVYKFYNEIPVTLSKEEIETLIEFQNNKNLKCLKRIDKNLNFITIFLKICIVIDIIVAIICLIIFLSSI